MSATPEITKEQNHMQQQIFFFGNNQNSHMNVSYSIQEVPEQEEQDGLSPDSLEIPIECSGSSNLPLDQLIINRPSDLNSLQVNPAVSTPNKQGSLKPSQSSSLIIRLNLEGNGHLNSSSSGSNPNQKNTFETICMVAEELTPEDTGIMQSKNVERRSLNVHPQMTMVRRESSFSKIAARKQVAKNQMEGSEVLQNHLHQEQSYKIIKEKTSSQSVVKLMKINRMSEYDSEMEMTYQMIMSQQSKSPTQQQKSILNQNLRRQSMKQVHQNAHLNSNQILVIQGDDEISVGQNYKNYFQRNQDQLEMSMPNDQSKSHFFKRFNGLQQSSQLDSHFVPLLPFNRQKTVQTNANLNPKMKLSTLMVSSIKMPYRNRNRGTATASVQSSILEKQKKKIKQLELQVQNSKIFLNMVIHDLRNPTNSIEFALREVIKLLNQQQSLFGSKNDPTFKNQDYFKGALTFEQKAQQKTINSSAYKKSQFGMLQQQNEIQNQVSLGALKASVNGNMITYYPISQSYKNKPNEHPQILLSEQNKEINIITKNTLDYHGKIFSPFIQRSDGGTSQQFQGQDSSSIHKLNIQQLVSPQNALGIHSFDGEPGCFKNEIKVPYSTPIRESPNYISGDDGNNLLKESSSLEGNESLDEEFQNSAHMVKQVNYKQSVLAFNSSDGATHEQKVKNRKFIQLTDILIAPPSIKLSQQQSSNNNTNNGAEICLRPRPSSNNHVSRFQQLSSFSPQMKQDPHLEFEAFVHNHERIESISESRRGSDFSENDFIEERDQAIGTSQKNRNPTHHFSTEVPPHLSILGQPYIL